MLLRSEPVAEGTPEIVGHDFETGRSLDDIMARMLTSGFQATHLGQAVDLVNEMVCFPCIPTCGFCEPS